MWLILITLHLSVNLISQVYITLCVLVWLGSHTIGQARCTTFRARLYNEANIDSSFATSLKANCPSSGGDANLSPLDVTTPNKFDNAYFKNLVSQKGLLHSDQQLFSGGSTNAQVNAYVSNPGSFSTDFANAMVKMGNLSPLTGTNGQIRTDCKKVNWVYRTRRLQFGYFRASVYLALVLIYWLRTFCYWIWTCTNKNHLSWSLVTSSTLLNI